MAQSVYPLKENGDVDVERVEYLYMASPHIDWTRFAEDNGFDPHYSRRQFPVRSWQDRKKKRIAEAEADKLGAMIFDRKYKWHKDVIKTLEDYPAACDLMMFLLKAKMNEYADDYKEYAKLKKEGQLPKYKNKRVLTKYERISAMDLKWLSGAMKDITEAKHKSLLLNNWTVKLAQEDAASEGDSDQSTKAIQIKLMGHGELSIPEVQKLMDEYLDQPQVIDLDPKESNGSD